MSTLGSDAASNADLHTVIVQDILDNHLPEDSIRQMFTVHLNDDGTTTLYYTGA